MKTEKTFDPFVRPTQEADVRLVECPGEHRGRLSHPQSPPVQRPADSTTTLEWTINRGTGGLLDVELWDPMAEGPILFHWFAEKVVDEESALVFFQNYGPLYWDNSDLWTGISPWETQREGVMREPVYDWLYEAIRARSALRTFRAIKNRDLEALEPPDFTPRYIVGSRATRTEILLNAQAVLRDSVNEGLRGRVTLRFELDSDKKGGFAMSRAPITLLGAMWLTFAVEVIGDTVVRECDYCRNLFSMTPDSERRGKRFCSDACRNKAFRRSTKGGESNDKTE